MRTIPRFTMMGFQRSTVLHAVAVLGHPPVGVVSRTVPVGGVASLVRRAGLTAPVGLPALADLAGRVAFSALPGFVALPALGTLAALVALGGALAAPLAAQQIPAAEIRERVDAGLPEAFALYRELLSYPNDAHHPEDILRLVAWLEARFAELGFTTERIATPGSPLLLAERPAGAPTGGGAEARAAAGPAVAAPSAAAAAGHLAPSSTTRTVLVYLQADGQPVDASRWDQASPWEPVLKERAADGGWREIEWSRLERAVARDGTGGEAALDPEWRIFARSAADSKGPVAQFLSAVALLDAAGVAPHFHMKVIVDTEEEQGSPHLPAAVRRHRDRLAADMLVIFDGPPHVSGRPTLTFGARGIATATLTTYGALVPQHSGHYGNYLPNPVFRLSRILASARDEDGRVTIPGWYDGVHLDAETKRILAAVPDDEPSLLHDMGVAARVGVGDNLQESVQYPSLNVRGMRAAWVGDEARTVIPDRAIAELDIRLVTESEPDRLHTLLRHHIEAQGFHLLDREPTPDERRAHPRLASLTWDLAYAAFRTRFDSEPGRWLTGAFMHLFGDEPIRIRTSGGSIPISPFVETLGLPAVTVPTVNPDNNQHSPNENLRVGSFVEGIAIILAVLQQPLERAP